MSERGSEQLSLADATTHLLEECRMITPGVQALLGFQFIAVFSNGFGEQLSHSEQCAHLTALALIAIATAFVMAPAAYHRQAGRRQATERFLVIGSRLLLVAMIALTLGVGIDFYLVARVILDNPTLSALVAAAVVLVFGFLWFVFPRVARRNKPRSS
jgi:hypothetical protein